MALPTLTKTWIISPCNRIVYVSLLDTMQRYLHGIKTFLKANGFTVKGSASAGVGAMDGVDRWTLTTNVTPRATVAAASQAWIVLTSSGSAIDIMLAYMGASDDVCRVSFSPGGLFVAAGTPQNQPTATDEVVDHNVTTTMIGITTGDRLWSGWVSSDAKMVRFALARGGFWLANFGAPTTGKQWCIETFNQTMTPPSFGSPTANPTCWIGLQGPNNLPNGTQIGRTRLVHASVPSVPVPQVSIHFGVESWPSNAVTASYPIQFGNEKPQLQGSLGYPILPINIYGNSTGYRGKVGNLIDQWTGRSAGDTPGDTYGALQFINMNGYLGVAAGGGVWPWDGVTVPVMA